MLSLTGEFFLFGTEAFSRGSSSELTVVFDGVTLSTSTKSDSSESEMTLALAFPFCEVTALRLGLTPEEEA